MSQRNIPGSIKLELHQQHQQHLQHPFATKSSLTQPLQWKSTVHGGECLKADMESFSFG